MFALQGGNKQEGQPRGVKLLFFWGEGVPHGDWALIIVQVLIKCSAKCQKNIFLDDVF